MINDETCGKNNFIQEADKMKNEFPEIVCSPLEIGDNLE